MPTWCGQQLREHAALADPAGDQLRVLTPVVDDHDLFLYGGPLRGIRGTMFPVRTGPLGERGFGPLGIRASLNRAGRAAIRPGAERSEASISRH